MLRKSIIFFSATVIISLFYCNESTEEKIDNSGEQNKKIHEIEYVKKFSSIFAFKKNGYKWVMSIHDTAVLPEMYQKGNFQGDNINAFFTLAKKYHNIEKGIFLDVGAHVGTTSIPVASRKEIDKVIAFEPSRENYSLLKSNIALNYLDEKIIPVKAAISNKYGTAILELSEDNTGDHRVRSNNIFKIRNLFNEDERETEQVRMITLDGYIIDNNINPKDIRFLWVDTQGYEYFILDGAKSLIRKDVAIIVEFWPYGLLRTNSLEKFVNLLKANYTHYIDMNEYRQKHNKKIHEIEDVDKIVKWLKNTSYFTDLFLINNK
ncbi:MAG TPA: FkbM family methyltransferase [Spirochaetota bacterium]|nr:FkbM family methyltransferase [Spirochaetota bacterium]